MVKLKKRKLPEAEIPSSSMADIAFLLLIFFLVSTTIDVDTGIGLSLPEWDPDTAVIPLGPDRLAAININENGDVLLDKKEIAIPQIANTLKPRILSKVDLPANKKLVVSVKTAAKTNYNIYIQALDQVKLAYFEIREEYALSKFGRRYVDIDPEQKKEITEKIPITISIAEPEKVK